MIPYLHSIQGLYFKQEAGIKIGQIDQIVTRIIAMGAAIDHIIVEGSYNDFPVFQEWQKNPLKGATQLINKIVDVVDVTEVGAFMMATRSRCPKRTFFYEEAVELVERSHKESVLVEFEGENWLLTTI